MSHLDNLIGSHLSLISQEDVRYDGILFSINAQESSIVLQKVRCLGTETRVTDPSKIVPVNNTPVAFVTFPGSDIKDLYVHDAEDAPAAPAAAAQASAPLPTPPTSASTAPPRPPANRDGKREGRGDGRGRAEGRGEGRGDGRGGRGDGRHGRGEGRGEAHRDVRREGRGEGRGEPRDDRHRAANPAPAVAPINSTVPAASAASSSTAAGTGAHLLKMRVKRADDGREAEKQEGEFDFQAGLSHFNKNEVLATVASSNTTTREPPKYAKDDFFDSLSCDVLDRAEGRSTRLNNQEERNLNTDTFGAIAVQSNYRRGYRGGGGHRGGRGAGGGRGYYRGGGGGAYRGRGRGAETA